MNLTNLTRTTAAWTLGLEPSGRELVVLAVKATYAIPERADREPVLLDEQLPLVEADKFSGEPGLSAPLREADFAPVKPACDVLLDGAAHAPGGRPAERVPVGLMVGDLVKHFEVVGERSWVKGALSFAPSRPKPFVTAPISYDVAFGGRDVSDPDPRKHRWYDLNHAGIGFHANLATQAVEGRPVARTEANGEPIGKPDGRYRPMSFGPVGRSWQPRARLAGTYDARWLEEEYPFPAHDLDPRYYQAAPADQHCRHLRGGERVELLNLTPAGRTGFRLPSLELPVTFYPVRGPKERVLAACDTLLIEPGERRFSVVWRATRHLRRDLFELAEAVVGDPSRAFERARTMGKAYHASLAALPRRRPQGGPRDPGERP